MKIPYGILALIFLGMLIGCTSPTASPVNTPQVYGTCTPEHPTGTLTSVTTTPYFTLTPQQSTSQPAGYTQQSSDGNRIVAGKGQIPKLEPLDIPLPRPATWVVAIPWEQGSLWVVTLDDGQVLGFQIDSQGWQPALITPTTLETGQPPLLITDGSAPRLLLAPSTLASPLTHPIPLTNPHLSQIFIDTDGNLIRVDPNLRQYPPLALQALPDARILKDERSRLLFLSGPTESYAHAVLGDAIEASQITLIPDPLQDEYHQITIPSDLVIEGLSPIWADLTGDGQREIIITVSNATQGAQILVYSENGDLLASGPTIGQGYRWRHQIAAAPFGPNGELEFVDVLTPHLGGIIEFYQLQGNQLQVVAQVPGYTSHVINTRNLDMAAAGDFDGDGSVELLLPRQDRSELGAIRRIQDGADVVWALPLDGKLTTNLGAVTLPNGQIAIGIGQENGILRIWHP